MHVLIIFRSLRRDLEMFPVAEFLLDTHSIRLCVFVEPLFIRQSMADD